MDDIPYLDLTQPEFSTKSEEVRAARAQHWCARTPFGLAVLRHQDAGALLRDRRLRQGSHAWPRIAGLSGSFAEFWQRSIISLEGPDHKALRQIALHALAPDFVAGLTPRFDQIATDLTAALPDRCEFISTFTEPFAGRAVTTLLGLPDEDAPQIAADASALGLAMGLDGRRHQARFNAAATRLDQLAATLLARANTGPETMIHRLKAAAGTTAEQSLRDLITILIFGGVDTTRAQLGFAAMLFTAHPAQWATLRENPDLAPQAVEEIIRHHPTTTWASREAVEEIDHKGTRIKAGQTVHILVHATALDPAIAADTAFDITARRKLHFGFGGGAHHCLGQGVARADMAAALRALAKRITHFNHDGPAELLPDSGNTSPLRLPLRLRFA